MNRSNNTISINQEKNHSEAREIALKSGGETRTGDFVMVTREIIRILSDKRIIDLSSVDKSICLVLLDKTIGQHCLMRPISPDEFCDATGEIKRTIFKRLKFLIENHVIKSEKIKGMRQVQYGFNTDFFGRTYPGQIENVYYLDKFKVPSKASSECPQGHFKSVLRGTQNPRKSATRVNSANPNISPKISSNISQREILEFLETRSLNSKNRWTLVVNNVVDKYPEDQSMLWLAIEIMEKTKTDLLGKPIRSSLLCLFEQTDWVLMKAILLTKLKTEKEEQEKRVRQRETEILVSEKRKSLIDETDKPIDISQISPLFKRFAERKA